MSFKDKWKKVKSEIKSRYEYMRGDKGVLESYRKKIKQWQPDNEFAKDDKEHALAEIDLMWFLFCLTKFAAKDAKTVFFDNYFIKKWEENKKNIKTNKDDSEFKKFFKNLQKSHPRVAATMQLWMIYALMTLSIAGGKVAYDKKGYIKETVKEWNSDKQENIAEGVYNVDDAKFKEKFVEENWDDIVICLLEYETWRGIPKLQSGEPRYTYGPGLTWVYVDGKQYKCVGEYAEMASHFTEEQIWDQVKQHCLYPGECFSLIQKGFKECGIKYVTKQQVLSLFVAGYQMPSRLRDGTAIVKKKDKKGKKIKEKVPYVGIIHRLAEAGTNTQKIVDSFIAGDEVDPEWRDGTNKRRWWCAMHYIEKINTEDLLSMDMDSFSKVKIDSVMKRDHFGYNDETIMYALSQQKPENKTVMEFIDSSIVLNNMEMLCGTNLVELGRKDKNILKQKSKKMAFDDGIMKIKAKQSKQGNIIYPFDNEYRA